MLIVQEECNYQSDDRVAEHNSSTVVKCHKDFHVFLGYAFSNPHSMMVILRNSYITVTSMSHRSDLDNFALLSPFIRFIRDQIEMATVDLKARVS